MIPGWILEFAIYGIICGHRLKLFMGTTVSEGRQAPEAHGCKVVFKTGLVLTSRMLVYSL